MTTNRPRYEATDSNGLPYMREVREVNELPNQDRITALEEITVTIERMLGVKALHRIKFGVPVYESFMRRPEAVKHVHRALLMTQGCHLSLDLCPTYN